MNISTPAEQGVMLSDSEIVRAMVQSVKEGGLITLLLKGSVIEALSEVPVKTGDNLFLQVDGFREGKAYLKVLTPADLDQAQNRTLASNLTAMGIPAKEDNVMMARTLLNHNLPVTQQNLGELGQIARMLGGLNEENLPVAAFAISRGVHLNPPTAASLQQFLTSPADTAELTRSILKSLDMLPSSWAGSPESDLAETVRPGKTGGEAGRDIPSIAKETAGISGQVSSGENAATSKNLSVDVSAGNLNRHQAEVIPFPHEIQTASEALKEIIDNIILKPVLQGQGLENSLNQRIAGERDTLGDLLLIKELFSKYSEDSQNPVLKELTEKIEVLGKELGGQRVYNAAVQSGKDYQSGFYYLSFPVQINHEQHLCELRLQKDPGYRSLRQQDNIRIVVSLDTPGMGIVLFHVNWYREGRIELQGIVEQPGVKQFLENKLGQLVRGITELGYQVQNLGLKLAESQSDTQKLKSTLIAPGPNCTLLAIDITI